VGSMEGVYKESKGDRECDIGPTQQGIKGRRIWMDSMAFTVVFS